MTIEALRQFRALVETGGFRAAAERVHRSQPAVSHQLKSLERELGHILLDRKTCKPTPAGSRLYEHACRLLTDVESIRRELGEFDESRVRELRLGTSDTTALYVLPPIIRRFARAMPHTHVEIVNRSTGAIAEQVGRGELDLGIVTLPAGHATLEERELFRQELVLVVPVGHRLRSRRRAKLEDLREEPFLLLDANTRTGTLLRQHFAQTGFEPHTVLDSGSFEVIKRYVAEGIGVSFLPRMVITRADRALTTLHVQGLPEVSIGAVWRKGSYKTLAAKTFLALMENA
ncbi:MAG: LysR family transcriptional regulator [Candidatus Hydrogenedentes bacterium]|nr:LysR family transcriptional regulator [Candidatus Hydrogenedentota bacterium]